ncbi:unnamed protein product [Urochloa humidicola]
MSWTCGELTCASEVRHGAGRATSSHRRRPRNALSVVDLRQALSIPTPKTRPFLSNQRFPATEIYDGGGPRPPRDCVGSKPVSSLSPSFRLLVPCWTAIVLVHWVAPTFYSSHPSVGVVGIPFTIDFAIIHSNPWQPPASRVNMHELISAICCPVITTAACGSSTCILICWFQDIPRIVS